MKLVSIIAALPIYTQISVLYPLLGSLNASAINMAGREVAQDLRDLHAAESRKMTNVISIDRYNEMLNELRERAVNIDHFVEIGTADVTMDGATKDVFDGEEQVEHVDEDGNRTTIPSAITHKEKVDRLSSLLTMRAPLLAFFNAAQASLPRGDTMPDFSFEESLARQLAREWTTEQRAADETDKAMIESGAVTAEELEAADKKRFDDDQAFKKEFKFLLLDKLNDKEPSTADEEAGNTAFTDLGWDFGSRLVKRILPKLEEAKRNQITRRTYDADAPTNIILIGLAINEMKKYVGESDAEKKLKALQQALTA